MKNVKRHWFRIGTRLIVLVAAWCVGVVLAWAWQAPDPTPAMFGDYTWKAPLVQFARGSFNIGENESPAPQNRLFVNYRLATTVLSDPQLG